MYNLKPLNRINTNARLSIKIEVKKVGLEMTLNLEMSVMCRMSAGDFLGPAFPASRMQHISDLRSKFALRPHHVWKYGRRPICDR